MSTSLSSTATSVSTVTPPAADQSLADRYREVRSFSDDLAAPLSPEDCVAQSMPNASPVKWHLAHTTWFFETFILEPHSQGYRTFHRQFSYLFNSYYNAVGDRIARPNRGLMTRPSLEQVARYRRHVDRAIQALLKDADRDTRREIDPLLEMGLHHEQQHQELICTDVKHLLSHNPLRPVYRDREAGPDADVGEARYIAFDGGVYEIGTDDATRVGSADAGFAYDNEGPRHHVHLRPFAVADRPVTNGEFLAFMEDGGYERHELWLDMGWAIVNEQGWRAPFYWERRDGQWRQFTLAGMQQVSPGEPICHLSYFEADAFARWAGKRLPTEAEWEIAARHQPIEGNFVETGRFHPITPPAASNGRRMRGLFGDVWEWTQSHYSPYPGYRPPEGAIGEYNGKFMCNQFVLRGGSCATPVSHIRTTYRNFWPPETRFQFTGLRLAEDR